MISGWRRTAKLPWSPVSRRWWAAGTTPCQCLDGACLGVGVGLWWKVSFLKTFEFTTSLLNISERSDQLLVNDRDMFALWQRGQLKRTDFHMFKNKQEETTPQTNKQQQPPKKQTNKAVIPRIGTEGREKFTALKDWAFWILGPSCPVG